LGASCRASKTWKREPLAPPCRLFGGALMAIGGLVVMWPAADRQRVQAGYAAVLKPRPVGELVGA